MKSLFSLLGILATFSLSQFAIGQNLPASQLKLADGFVCQQVAGDELASNIFAMTLDPAGNPVVAGPGYIKRLIDRDGDHVYENAELITDAFPRGVQGMCFDGNDLLVVGGNGLWRLAKAAMGPVAGNGTLLMPIKTGGEHDAHAIRKGPHGWWYLIAGNATTIRPEYHANVHSPVKKPTAGFLMRMSPDFKQKQIFAHGFRNAYDFDFDSQGNIFVYDSDGERDKSLPWYRPTRVFNIGAGDHAGWVSAGWKRPSHFFDLPIVAAAFGRGSPTGVVCNRHPNLPAEYQDAIFVGDWTFGKINVVKRVANSAGKIEYQGEVFAEARNQFGFAVTDIEQLGDGSLLVSVGGRGTAGGVFRINNQQPVSESQKPMMQEEAQSVTASQWNLVLDWARPGDWSAEEYAKLNEALKSESNSTRNAALRAIIGRELGFRNQAERNEYEAAINGAMASLTRETEFALFRVLSQRSMASFKGSGQLSDVAQCLGFVAKLNALPVNGAGVDSARKNSLDACLATISKLAGEASGDSEKKQNPQVLMLIRLAQLAVGGERAMGPEVFRGYTAPLPVPEYPLVVSKFLDCFEKCEGVARWELGRLAAMLQFRDPRVQDVIVRQLNQGQSLENSIHWLICLSRLRAPIRNENVAKLVAATLAIPKQLERDEAAVDRNWKPRMTTLFQSLLRSPNLTSALLNQPEFGGIGQAFLINAVPAQARPVAAARVFQALKRQPAAGTVDHLRLLSQSRATNEVRGLLRSYVANPETADAAILALCSQPMPSDYASYREGLNSLNANVLKQSTIALRRIAPSARQAEDIVSVFRVVRRLSWDKRDVSIRDQLVMLLRQWTRRQFGYRLNSPNVDQTPAVRQWEQFLKNQYSEVVTKVLGVDQSLEMVATMKKVDWTRGDAKRGEATYKKLQCANCHDGGSGLGPALEGVTARFNRQDLFRAIVMPNEQVSDRYRATIVETVDGILYRGTVIYDSIDGVTLLDADGKTIRINANDIESRGVSDKSLMPQGLLDQASPQDWADLYAYLKTR